MRSNVKSNQENFRVSERERKAVEQLANQWGVTRSEAYRRAVFLLLDKQQNG